MNMHMLIKILQGIKYRNFKLKSEGSNCSYRLLSSTFSYPENLILGDDVHLGKGTEIDAAGGVEIGSGVIFAPEVCVYSRTHNFNSIDLVALPFDNRMLTAKVKINDYVWIGRRVIILPGVKIGKAAVIGAGSVVSKDIPDYAVAVGNPAKVVKYRDSDKVKNLLMEDIPFVYSKFGHKKEFIRKENLK